MLKVLTIKDSSWNTLVKSFKNYSVHYLKEYVEAFKNQGDGEPFLFYSETNDLKAIYVVFKRKIEDSEYFDLRTPYGYGGWLFEGTGNKEEVYKEYINWCKDNNIVSEFVRFSLFEEHDSYYGKVIERIDNVVRNLEDSFENIENDFERRVRKDLKKTDKLEIIFDRDGKYLDDYLRIYNATMKRNNAEDEYYFSKDFYLKLNEMKENVMYFHVALDSKIISTELVIYDNNNMYSYLGGTDNEYFAYHPNHFIKYHIIKWGVENHLKNFVLGGGYGTNDGIFLFKKGFAPNGIYKFYTGQMIFNEDIYNKLVDNKVKEGLVVEGNNYFPLYRAK